MVYEDQLWEIQENCKSTIHFNDCKTVLEHIFHMVCKYAYLPPSQKKSLFES